MNRDATSPDLPEARTAEDSRGREREMTVRPIRDGRRESRAVRLIADDSANGNDADLRSFSLGWKASLLLNLVLLGAPMGLVIALPPVLDCRERETHFGFFAGETFSGCAAHGIGRRLRRLDDRIKMLVRGSGR